MQKKTGLAFAFSVAIIGSLVTSLSAQTSAFTYQGKLSDGGTPANGTFDLRFTIYDAVTNGNAISSSQTNPSVAVSNGLFTTSLDFGANVFNGSARWLDIGVRTNGNIGGFTLLAPRQPLTSTPYAIQAANAVSALQSTTATVANSVAPGAVTISALDSNIFNAANLTGTIPDARLSANVPVLNFPYAFLQFELDQSLPVGGIIDSATAADVNGDGYVDLIAAQLSFSSLSILTNNGLGGFSLAQSVTVGSFPIFVTTADVNGDNRLDLICANHGTNTLSVLTNNGFGAFSLAQSPVVGTHPRSVVAVDVNGDNRVDLISANEQDNTMSITTNKGSGIFALAQTVNVGAFPQSVAASDVNGDNRVDLVSANRNDNTLSLFTNNGAGVFLLAQSMAVGAGPDSVTIADVNGDNRLDLVSANSSVSTLSVLTNNGAGVFSLSQSPAVGATSTFVAAADINADNRIDLITANFIANSISVLTNNGTGVFSLAQSLGMGILSGPEAVVVTDVNRDTRVDIISANHNGNLAVLLSKAVPQTFSSPTAFTNAENIFSGNGDGLTSLNATEITSGTLPDARLSTNVFLLTGKLPDNNLSSNVALLNANQTFTGSNIFQSVADQVPWRITSGTSGNVSAQVLGGGNSGFQSINFNGYYSGGTEFRYNTNKARWRMIVDQRSSDFYSIEVFNGVSLLNALTLSTSGNLAVAGTVNGSSDKNVKTNFARVDVAEILEKVAALPLSTWVYKSDDQTKHVGPMAQDFYSSFGFGTDDKHISMVDADGVALAAIQGLNQKLSEKDKEIQTLQKRLSELESVVNRLASPK